jgi:hypothetical protein
MTALLERTNPTRSERRDDDRIVWTGVLYGHMMPGLPLAASRLAAVQRRNRSLATIAPRQTTPSGESGPNE